MRDLKISYGHSANALKWSNQTTTWEALCERLKTTVKTAETMEQYRAMSRPEREAVKDIGGFVGGHLKNGRRLVENVECRSFLTLDADSAEKDFLDQFLQKCGYAAVIYTTHGHTPDAPRYRIVMPFAEDITPDCYNAVARLYAAQWGIDQFDVCSYRVNQLMYWPSTPSDVDYICRVIEGPFMNAMDFLAAYPDWQDCSKLPIASKEKPLRDSNGRKQEDPLLKEGIVGAFCRTYTIHDVIAKYLTDVYAPSVKEGRYDYIPGEGTAGVVVYDDKFAYSHHATDPVGGRLLNAFDLVRLHRFGDDEGSFQKMCALAEHDQQVQEALRSERNAQARKDFETIASSWEEPLAFGKNSIDAFPLDALPKDIADYVFAVAESTQTPVDMAATVALSILSVCLQGKYHIQGKADWLEPLNTYALVSALPSERKSAVLNMMLRPLHVFEQQFNLRNAANVENSKMLKRALERRQKAAEDQFAKGKVEKEELERIAREVTDFEEEKPLQLYVDDITTEKLVSVLSANKGRAALISSEGGIFDTLAGIYTRNVNIDVMLKGYSGDTIRVDRIGRDSESVMNPALTVLLMAQPGVVSAVLGNKTFRGRGLTARFLYCIPDSRVGTRLYDSKPVSETVYGLYDRKIVNLLEDEYSGTPSTITVSPEASRQLSAFSSELEPKLAREYVDIADWAGKLIGNTLRIAGLLCRANVYLGHGFLDETADTLVVDSATMENAIRIGRYYLCNAIAAYNVLPEKAMYVQANRILKTIAEKALREFDRRTAMRYCQSFKTVSEIQPVLDFLEDYGYISQLPCEKHYSGRPPVPRYLVNPLWDQTLLS